MNKHLGSKINDFLIEEGLLEEAESVAAKRVFVFEAKEATPACCSTPQEAHPVEALLTTPPREVALVAAKRVALFQLDNVTIAFSKPVC